MNDWNPRYLAYAAAHGHPGDPDGMLAADRVRWPGGFMCGYICWIHEMVSAFKKACPGAFIGDHLCDHKGFDDFLTIETTAKAA